MRIRVKICGITRQEDAQAAISAGADAIGFVFYPPSPRAVSIEQARSIMQNLPAFVSAVGLFVNADSEQIRSALQAGIDLIQFHGQECPDYCASFHTRWIKAIRVKPGLDLKAESRRYRSAAGLLFDAYHPDKPGGTGQTFDWQTLPDLDQPIILAGGLNPQNIRQAIQIVRPYAVDVSGGVEKSPGIKDDIKIKQFMRGVRESI